MQRTNARGGHTYCTPFKAWIVEQAVQPGMSLAGLAMNNEVNANQLRRWVQRHGAAASNSSSTARLLPVTVTAPERAPLVVPGKTGSAVEIELASVIVRVRDGASSATQRIVLDALRPSSS